MLDKQDIMTVPKGSTVVFADGSKITVDREGYFLSQFYLEKVAEARIKRKGK